VFPGSLLDPRHPCVTLGDMDGDPGERPENETSPEGEFEELDRLLQRLSEGDSQAEGPLLELVHSRMRTIARSIMRNERPGHTLQPTALVNEAWLKFSAGRTQRYQNRQHFFSVAATDMRRVLLDDARGRLRQRRTAGADDLNRLREAAAVDEQTEQMLALDQALNRLAEHGGRLAKIVELRCFCDLGVAETATVLEVSPTTVKRELQIARTFLGVQICNKVVGSPPDTANRQESYKGTI
jgi:RNA polymerase sigma factor (TIGR02999 family)